MKKLINIFTSVGVALSLLVGCATINSLTPAQVAQIGTVVTQVADDGAVYAIQQSPSSKAYFLAAIPVLDNFANGTDLSPAALQKALGNSPLATNLWVGLAITAVVTAYDVSYSQYISNQLTNAPAAKIWITDAELGFKEATGTTLAKLKVAACPSFIVKGKVDKAVIKAKVKAAVKAGK
jgi:hypothetical protein